MKKFVLSALVAVSFAVAGAAHADNKLHVKFAGGGSVSNTGRVTVEVTGPKNAGFNLAAASSATGTYTNIGGRVFTTGSTGSKVISFKNTPSTAKCFKAISRGTKGAVKSAGAVCEQ